MLGALHENFAWRKPERQAGQGLHKTEHLGASLDGFFGPMQSKFQARNKAGCLAGNFHLPIQ